MYKLQSFGVEDIRKIRDFNYEFTKKMQPKEIVEFYKKSASAGFAEIERIRKEKLLRRENA